MAFTPEDSSASQGISVSVSNSFLSRHGNLPVPSVSRSLPLLIHKLVNMIFLCSLCLPTRGLLLLLTVLLQLFGPGMRGCFSVALGPV